MLTMLICWWWAGLIHHFITHVVYVFMTVYESQSFTKLIAIHPIVFERFLRKSKELIRSVGTLSHSRRFRFISQIRRERKTTRLLVCLCRSQQLDWDASVEIWSDLHFRPPPTVVLDPICKNDYTFYVFFFLKLIWICQKNTSSGIHELWRRWTCFTWQSIQ